MAKTITIPGGAHFDGEQFAKLYGVSQLDLRLGNAKQGGTELSYPESVQDNPQVDFTPTKNDGQKFVDAAQNEMFDDALWEVLKPTPAESKLREWIQLLVKFQLGKSL